MVLKKCPGAESAVAPLRLSLPPAPADPEALFGLKEGDFVKVSGDVESVQSLQAGHGDWVESMSEVGRV